MTSGDLSVGHSCQDFWNPGSGTGSVYQVRAYLLVVGHRTRAVTRSLSFLFLAATALIAVARDDPFFLPPDYHRYAHRSQGINWKECGLGDAPRQYARFGVPLGWLPNS